MCWMRCESGRRRTTSTSMRWSTVLRLIEILRRQLRPLQFQALTAPICCGGRYIVRAGRSETLEGNWQPARFVILEFKDMDTARAWWASPEYAEAKALRQSCADAEMLLIEGFLSP